MGVESEPWWDELLQLRNELSLRELAEKFGASPGEISLALKRAGVRREPKQAQGTTAGGSAAGAGDSKSARPGSKDALLNPLRDLMGQISDSEIAEKAGVSMRTVASYRRRHDIAAYTGRGKPKKRFRRSKIDPFAELVGKIPDRLVAEKAGVTLNAVRNYRTNRGIASSRAYAREQREAAAAVAAQEVAAGGTATAPAPTAVPVARQSHANDAVTVVGTGAFAWKVRFASGLDGVVTAKTAAEAATVAAAHDANVVAVERIGRLI